MKHVQCCQTIINIPFQNVLKELRRDGESREVDRANNNHVLVCPIHFIPSLCMRDKKYEMLNLRMPANSAVLKGDAVPIIPFTLLL